jgi:hypothetical protein
MADRKSGKGGASSRGGKTSRSKTGSAGSSRRTSARSSSKSGASRGASSSGHGGSSSNGRGGMTAVEAARAARESLAALLGRPVETVLGIDRDRGSWVVKAQVLELARVPNTTDVLGEYEAVLDGRGDLVRYSRTGRYHRGQVDSDR